MVRFAPELKSFIEKEGQSFQVERQQLICTQGEKAEFLVYVPNGTLEVRIASGRINEEVIVDWIQTDECFFLLDGLQVKNYPANLYATQAVNLIKVPIETVLTFLSGNPDLTRRLTQFYSNPGLRSAVKRISNSSRARSEFYFNMTEFDSFKTEAVKIKSGDIPNWSQGLYIVNAGRARLSMTKEQKKIERFLTIGDVFSVEDYIGRNIELEIAEDLDLYKIESTAITILYNQLKVLWTQDLPIRDFSSNSNTTTAKIPGAQIEVIRKWYAGFKVHELITTTDSSEFDTISLYNAFKLLGAEIPLDEAHQLATFAEESDLDFNSLADIFESKSYSVEFIQYNSYQDISQVAITVWKNQICLIIRCESGRLFYFDPSQGVQKIKDPSFLTAISARILLISQTPGIQELLNYSQDPKINDLSLRKFIYQNLERHRGLLWNLLGLAFILGVITSTKGIIFQKVITQVSSLQETSVVLGFGYALIALGGFYFLINILFTLLTEYIRIYLSNRLKTLLLKINYFSSNLNRSIANRSMFLKRIDSLDGFSNQLISNPINLIKSAVSLSIMLIFLATISVKYFLIYAGFIGIGVMIIIRFIRNVTANWARMSASGGPKEGVLFPDFAKALYSSDSKVQLNYFKEKTEVGICEQNEASATYQNNQKRTLFLLKLLGLCFYSLVYYYGIIESFNSPEAAAAISGLLIYLGYVYGETNQFFNLFSSFGQWSESFQQLQSFFTPNEIYNGLKNHPRHVRLNGKIRFDGVSLKYPETVMPAISQVSVTIQPGEFVIIVGKSGSGKSTFVKLLAQELAPNGGRILFDEQESRNLSPSLLRSQICMVNRRPDFFPGTVRDNILVNRQMNTWMFDNALKISSIASNPKTIARILGVEIDQQQQGLSSGEKQMVGIARTVYQNPRILILDEATCYLDAKSEIEIIDNLYRNKKDKTIVLVTHQLALSKYADRILVFKDGFLAESGTHDQLLRAGKEYAELYRSKGGLD